MQIVESIKDLTLLLRAEHDRQAQDQDAIIVPAQLTETILKILDPRAVSPSGVRLAARLEINQLAREVCREKWRREEAASESGDLFEFRLQPRYPAERNGEDAYVPRLLLTAEERWKNIHRLESESASKAAHALALRAETEALIADGKLDA